MRVEFSEQFSVPCVVLNEEDEKTLTSDGLINACRNAEALYDDGEDICFVVEFPGRYRELYTESALRRSLPNGAQ